MEKRKIAMSDGTSMGDFLYIFETNAPITELKELEKKSCEAYISGNGEDDVPIWADVLIDKGYVFNYINEHRHVTPYGTSGGWMEREYPDISETYTIENQPKV